MNLIIGATWSILPKQKHDMCLQFLVYTSSLVWLQCHQTITCKTIERIPKHTTQHHLEISIVFDTISPASQVSYLEFDSIFSSLFVD